MRRVRLTVEMDFLMHSRRPRPGGNNEMTYLRQDRVELRLADGVDVVTPCRMTQFAARGKGEN